MTEKIHEITEQTIKLLVNNFYKKVRKDPELGPVFERTIGPNDDDWIEHLSNMYDFWSSIMLRSGRYHGTPMQKHLGLPPFDAQLFDRWLELFFATAQDIHSVDIAEEYRAKSTNIARSLKMAIFSSLK